MCFRWYSLRSHLFIADVIIIIFILTTLLWNIFQAFRSLARSLLTFLSLRSFLFTSFHVFLGRPLMKLPLTLKVLHLLGQALSPILSKRPNHCSLLSCKNPSCYSGFSVVLSSTAEILFSDLALHIYLTILIPFIPSFGITANTLYANTSRKLSISKFNKI